MSPEHALTCSRFITPPRPARRPGPESDPPPLTLAKLDAEAIGRVFRSRFSRLSAPTDNTLHMLMRDMGIAMSVDVVGVKAIEVARLHKLPRSRVSTIMAQIRAEAGQ